MGPRKLGVMSRQTGWCLLAAGSAITALSCGSDAVAPTPGSLEVTTSTTGPYSDVDGYTIAIDEVGAGAIGVNATLRRDNLNAGTHTIRLEGISANCALVGENPQSVTLEVGGTAQVAFAISCRTTGQGQIVFQATPEGDNSEIYIVNADGTGLRRLTNYPGPDFAPSWSPDGSEIYFTSSGRDGQRGYSLYAMGPEGDNVRVLLAHPPGNLHTWSPDGERMAFTFDTPSDGTPNDGAPESELYVSQADGSGARRLIDFPGLCDAFDSSSHTQCRSVTSISWSPDGKQLVYSTHQIQRWPTFSRYIWMVNDDGTGWRLLPGGTSFGPSWSPDGQRIAFATGASADRTYAQSSDITIVDVSSGLLTGVVPGGLDQTANALPSWSPDGGSLAFSRAPFDQFYRLFVVSVDGSGLRLLADVPGAALPKWRPR